MKRTIILFLIVFASITFAQSKPILPEWYRGLNVSADINLEITYGDADQLVFDYTVRALEDSVQPIFLINFFLPHLSEFLKVNYQITIDNPIWEWSINRNEDGGILGLSEISRPHSLYPGNQLDFSIQLHSNVLVVPTFSEFWYKSFPSADEFEQHGVEEGWIYQFEKPTEERDYYRVLEVPAPKVLPSDYSINDLIAEVIADWNQACELGWTRNQGICQSFRAKLEAAQESMERCSYTSAQGQLIALLNHLDAVYYAPNPAINRMAYDLLLYNTEFILSHLILNCG